jgi:hypothetical protein
LGVIAIAALVRLRRRLDALLGFAAVLAVLAPLLLGPALGPVTRALGGVDEHRCACGMVRGKCGCPECEHLEQARLREQAPRPYPELRSQCGADDPVTPVAALPAGLTTPFAALLPRPETRIVKLERPVEARSRGADEPATPPPRRATV